MSYNAVKSIFEKKMPDPTASSFVVCRLLSSYSENLALLVNEILNVRGIENCWRQVAISQIPSLPMKHLDGFFNKKKREEISPLSSFLKLSNRELNEYLELIEK